MALSLITRPIEAKSSVAFGVSFTDDDLWATIGAAAEQKAFAQRTLALSNPTTYQTNRDAALAELKKAAAESFKATFSTYGKAGVDQWEAKKLALAASKQTYDSGMKALRMVYPSAADNLYQVRSTAPAVMRATVASRSAPRAARKKKAASKRRK